MAFFSSLFDPSNKNSPLASKEVVAIGNELLLSHIGSFFLEGDFEEEIVSLPSFDLVVPIILSVECCS